MKEKHQCSQRVYGPHRLFTGSPCSRNGVNKENSQWWCRQHTPSLVETKRKKEHEQWVSHNKARNEEHERIAALQALRDRALAEVLNIVKRDSQLSPVFFKECYAISDAYATLHAGDGETPHAD